MNSCSCTLSYTNPDACKSCPNNKVYGYVGTIPKYTVEPYNKEIKYDPYLIIEMNELIKKQGLLIEELNDKINQIFKL